HTHFLYIHDPPPYAIYTLSLHDALPICKRRTVPLPEQVTETIEPYRTNRSALDQRLHSALATLPELHRAALTLRYFEEMDYRSIDRKSTRLNSSHRTISYAVFCLKKKIK